MFHIIKHVDYYVYEGVGVQTLLERLQLHEIDALLEKVGKLKGRLYKNPGPDPFYVKTKISLYDIFHM